MTVNEKIAKIRERMAENHIDAVIVPSADPHMSEYYSEHWKTRAWLSGFTGSAGSFVITQSVAGLWTDGRYYVQAEKQLSGSEGVLFKMNEPETPKIHEYLAKELPENAVVGINGQLFSVAYVKEMQKAFKKKNIQIDNQVDYANDLWEDRPAESATAVYNLPVKYAGKSAQQKIEELRGKLTEQRQELMNARFKHAAAQLEKTSELKAMRKQVARIETVLNEKEQRA